MKKRMVFLAMMCAFLPTVVLAEEQYKDNSLQLDSQRLEEESQAEVNTDAELTKNLFSLRDRETLEESKANAVTAFDKQQAQLFTADKTSNKKVSPVDQLFVGQGTNYVTKVDTNTNTTSQTSGGWTTVLYGAVCLALVCGASFATYIVYKGED